MWLSISGRNIIVDCPMYIASQPVNFSQIEDQISNLNEPMDAIIDVSCVDLLDVDLVGFVRIIWELHKRTYGRELIRRIHFHGVPPVVMNIVLPMLPSFVRKLIKHGQEVPECVEMSL